MFRVLTSTRVAERGRPQGCLVEALRKQEDVQNNADREKDIAALSQLSIYTSGTPIARVQALPSPSRTFQSRCVACRETTET